MKTIIKLTATLFCITFFIIAEAQNSPDRNNNQRNVKFNETASTVGSYSNRNTASGGSPYVGVKQNYGEECSMYLDEKWSEGTVILKDKTVITDRLLRYNLYNQQMEFINDEDTAAFGNPSEIASINFDRHNFIYKDYVCHNELKKGFFEVLVNDDCELLLFRCIKYKYVEQCADPNTELVMETYYMEKKYFIAKDNEPAMQIPEKKKDVIELLSDKKDIKQFIKKNRIKVYNEDDLKKLISYYNED
ncbi:MAG: hypothetical protein B6D61_12720 [Bacteroidetes bacterium 4484_249]|nr:MAG: hypothetical protein B6D61_12720 [Bacteroidetes bacterium 4484_249]